MSREDISVAGRSVFSGVRKAKNNSVLEFVYEDFLQFQVRIQITWVQLYLRVHSGKLNLFDFTSVLMKREFGPQAVVQESTCV